MAKKFAKKIATYAMAATMIGGAVIGSGSTGVFAAEKYPSSATAKSAYSKVMSNTGTNYKKSYEDYKKAYEDFMNQYMQAPTVAGCSRSAAGGSTGAAGQSAGAA